MCNETCDLTNSAYLYTSDILPCLNVSSASREGCKFPSSVRKGRIKKVAAVYENWLCDQSKQTIASYYWASQAVNVDSVKGKRRREVVRLRSGRSLEEWVWQLHQASLSRTSWQRKPSTLKRVWDQRVKIWLRNWAYDGILLIKGNEKWTTCLVM